MKTRWFTKVLILVSMATIVFGFNNCGQMSFLNLNPVTSLSGGGVAGNPLTSLTVTQYSAQHSSAVSDLVVCLNRLDLQGSDPKSPLVQLNFTKNQELTIPSAGVALESLPIPPGQYTQISLELANVCGSGRSLTVANASGSFQTSQPVILQFNGNVTVGSSQQNMFFSIQPIVNNLSLLTSSNSLPSQAQASAGSFAPMSCVSNYPATVLADAPAGYWRLNETSGTTAFDLGPTNNNATYTGTSIGQAPPFAGIGNYSASRSPSTPYLAITTAANNLGVGGTNALTIEFWVRTTALTVGQGIGVMTTDGAGGSTDTGYGFGLGTVPCLATQFNVYKGNGVTICIDGYTPDTNWHHYAMSSGGAGVQIYVDGALAGTSTDTQNYATCGPWCPLDLGNSSATTYLFAETAIYPAALSAARIQAHFAASTTCQ